MDWNKLQLEYRPKNSKLWLIIGWWYECDMETKDALYKEADAMEGTLRVLEISTGLCVFQRPTASSYRIANDDCHTYS